MGLYAVVIIALCLMVGLAIITKSVVVILVEAIILVGALLLLYPFLVAYTNSRHIVKNRGAFDEWSKDRPFWTGKKKDAKLKRQITITSPQGPIVLTIYGGIKEYQDEIRAFKKHCKGMTAK
jgi:hypothetical protein